MKWNGRNRILAFVLAAAMLLDIIPTTAFASEDGGNVSSVEVDASLEGNNDVGTMIASEISDAQDEQDELENYIIDLEVNRDEYTASVKYQISEETTTADIVVAIYDEEMEQMYASGTVSVSRDENSCTVSVEGEIPAYFVAAAYLLEEDTHRPISKEFICNMYTEEMQEFLGQTVNDFDEGQVLNLDENDSTNFLVYSDDVVVGNESEYTDVEVVDNGDGTYIIYNADEELLGLAAGDIFSWRYEDGNVLIVQIQSVNVDGTTVTITEDEDAELTDVFSYIKIDMDSENAEVSVDTSEMSDDLTYLGMTGDVDEEDDENYGIDLAAYEFDESVKSGISYKLGKSGISGTFSMNLTVRFKMYASLSYQYMSLGVEYTLKASISGTIKTSYENLKMGKVIIPLCPGIVDATITPKLSIEISGKVEGALKIKGTVGVAYDSDTGFINLGEDPKCSLSLEFEGKVFIGFKLEPALEALSGVAAKAKETTSVGVEITMKSDLTGSNSSSTIHHTCVCCYEGVANGKLSAEAEFSFLNKWIKVSTTFLEMNMKLFDFYWSYDHNEWGFGSGISCPYISYKLTVKAVDEDGNPVCGATITWGDAESVAETGDDGTAEIFLPNGKYSLEANLNNLWGDKNVTIAKKAKTVKIKMEKTGWDMEETEIETESESELIVETETETENNAESSGEFGDGLSWNLDSNGTLTISGTGAMPYVASDSELPWSTYRDSIVSGVIESGVTSIGPFTFSLCTNLTHVEIADTVTSIGNHAFEFCNSLTNIEIPDSVETIGPSAFYSAGLEYITIPDSVTRIESLAFAGCNMEQIVIPDSVTYLGEYVFYECTSLTDITLSKNLTYIFAKTFMNCYSLTNIVIPENVEQIFDKAFYQCTSLTTITIPDGVTDIGAWAFFFCEQLEEISLPASVTTIGERAFSECSKLTEIIIPDGVTEIASSTFSSCTSLVSVVLPKGLTQIYEDAFAGCYCLSNIYYAGTETEWWTVTVDSTGNEYFLDAASEMTYGYTGANSALTQCLEEETESGMELASEEDTNSQINVENEATDDETVTEAVSEAETETTETVFETNLEEIEIDLSTEGVSSDIEEDEQYTESATESATEYDIIAEETSESTDTAMLTGNSLVKTMMAYLPFSSGSSDSLQTVSFENLVAGEDYILVVVKDTEADVLNADNLLYIAQGTAGTDGCASFSYLLEDQTGTARAYGLSAESIGDAEISLERDVYEYTGAACVPNVSIIYNGDELEEDVDYTLSYENNIEIGTATVTVKGRDNYSGKVTVSFTICEPETEIETETETETETDSDQGNKDETEETPATNPSDGSEQESPAVHTHTVGGWTTAKAATCLEAGKQVQKCTSCGEVINEKTIAATGHNYGEWKTTSEATVLAEGTMTHTCSVCGAKETKAIAKLTPTITVNATSIKLKKKQSTTALKVTGLAAGDSVVSWKSSNTKIVTVNAKGKITAKNKTGTAYITITLKSGKTQKIKVKVQKSAVKTTKITVDSKKVSLKKGKTYTIKATISPITSVQKVTYSSSNKKVATVNSKGKITAKKKGTATITVKSGSKKVKIKVTVK